MASVSPVKKPLPFMSLVVATVGRTREFEVMLQSLCGQSDRRFETIVVDQNPDDRLVSLIDAGRSGGLDIVHVRRTQRGATAARNFGLACAQAPLIGFPDDDCWYEPDVVAKALQYFKKNREISALVGRWDELDPRHDRAATTMNMAEWRQYKGGDVPCFVLFFRRDKLIDIGGFAENFGPGCYFSCAEEEDLLLRMLATGLRVDTVPTIAIHHPYADAPVLTPAQRRRNRIYGRGTGACQLKHGLPVWVIARGLVGPFWSALRAPNPVTALILGGYTVIGRIEGIAGWWLLERRGVR